MTNQSPWYVHDLNPIAFTIAGEAVPWYWLVYLAGFFWCWWFLERSSTSSHSSSSVRKHNDFSTYAAVAWCGVILGARLGYILFYNPSFYWNHPDQIIAIWNGGMSFHGGLIGIALSTWIFARQKSLQIFTFTDPLAVAIPWPLALGRIANFVNGELPGRPTSLPWAVLFPEPWNDLPRHPSQLYEACSEGLILGLIMAFAWNRLRMIPGASSTYFLLCYGCLRFVTEYSREADPQIGYFTAGLTMGQLLCLAMVAASFLMMHRISHSMPK